MTDPDQTPILNRIDRQLHAVAKRPPAEAIAAYRSAALTAPTFTGTAAAPKYLPSTHARFCAACNGSGTWRAINDHGSSTLHACTSCHGAGFIVDAPASHCDCAEGTSTCRRRSLEGGQIWTCAACSREWIVPDTYPEDPDVGYWSSVVVFLAVFGSGLVLAIGFGLGYVFRGWSA